MLGALEIRCGIFRGEIRDQIYHLSSITFMYLSSILHRWPYPRDLYSSLCLLLALKRSRVQQNGAIFTW